MKTTASRGLKNDLVLKTAEAEGAISLLLDIQQDCIKATIDAKKLAEVLGEIQCPNANVPCLIEECADGETGMTCPTCNILAEHKKNRKSVK